MFFQVHARHEKLHVLRDIGPKDVLGPIGDAVSVLLQPGCQAIGFLGGQDDDVIFADRVFSLDLHAQRLFGFRGAGAD